jgi:hypothetical protein
VVHDRLPVDKVKELDSDTYYVRGSTALLDAVGGAIHHIGNVHKYAREEDRPAKTLFIITTDGMENASRRFRYEDIRALVDRHREQGWEFLFLGANIDAISVAGRMGISEDRAVEYHADSQGTLLNFRAVGEAISHIRTPKSAPLSAGWKAPIEADRKNRKRSR